MHHHCFEPIKDGFFLLDKFNHNFVFEFKFKSWESISDPFPCDNEENAKVTCKSYDNEIVVVPGVKSGSSCTGMFNITSRQWSKLKVDLRNAPYNGTLEYLPNDDGQEVLLYFGGYEVNERIRDEKIWEFKGPEEGWQIYPQKLSMHLRENTTRLTLLHPDICST